MQITPKFPCFSASEAQQPLKFRDYNPRRPQPWETRPNMPEPGEPLIPIGKKSKKKPKL